MALITSYSTLQTAMSDFIADTIKSSFYPVYIQLFEDWVNSAPLVGENKVQFLCRQQVTTTTLTLSSSSATLPTDYLAWISVEWGGRTPPILLKYIHPGMLTTSTWLNPAGNTTEAFTIIGDTLYVRPTDSANNSVVFRYYAKVPGLATTDPNWLLTAHPALYLWGSLAEAAQAAGSDQDIQTYLGRRDEMAGRIAMLAAQTPVGSDIREGEYI